MKAPTSSPPLVEVRDLYRVFDVSKPWLNRVIEREPRRLVRAVDGVSFSIRKGETFALVGESGSGKSTIARMIAGLIPPSRGQILFDGTDISNPANAAEVKRLRRRFQMVFQDPYASLNPRFRVDAIIAEPLTAFGLATDRATVEGRVAELLRLVKLDPSSAGNSRTNSPAGSASASPSRGRWRPIRISSSATSRHRLSMSRCRRRC